MNPYEPVEGLYVNAKQYHRILKRREARAKLEERLRGVQTTKKPYLHESRHKHAMRRPRGPGGRFLTADKVSKLRAQEAAEAAANGGSTGDDVNATNANDATVPATVSSEVTHTSEGYADSNDSRPSSISNSSESPAPINSATASMSPANNTSGNNITSPNVRGELDMSGNIAMSGGPTNTASTSGPVPHDMTVLPQTDSNTSNLMSSGSQLGSFATASTNGNNSTTTTTSSAAHPGSFHKGTNDYSSTLAGNEHSAFPGLDVYHDDSVSAGAAFIPHNPMDSIDHLDVNDPTATGLPVLPASDIDPLNLTGNTQDSSSQRIPTRLNKELTIWKPLVQEATMSLQANQQVPSKCRDRQEPILVLLIRRTRASKQS